MHTFDRAVAASLPLVPRTLVRRFADRYMAGETLEDAVATVRRLNSQDTMATVDVLGEIIRVPEEAEATTTAYERVLDAIAAESLDANISVKLSAWGWSSTTLSPTACSRGCSQPPSATTSSSASTWSTPAHRPHAAPLSRPAEAGHEQIGVVLQAYLRRTMDDVRALADLAPSVRVVKGIYIEPEEIAYRTRRRSTGTTSGSSTACSRRAATSRSRRTIAA